MAYPGDAFQLLFLRPLRLELRINERALTNANCGYFFFGSSTRNLQIRKLSIPQNTKKHHKDSLRKSEIASPRLSQV